MDSEIDAILESERAQVDAQRATADRAAAVQAQQQRSLHDLVGEALAPRVAALQGPETTDLQRHDFWRGIQGLAQSLATMQTTTPDGQPTRSRQLDLPEIQEQARLMFQGASPAQIDAIAIKLHGNKPAESVAAMRDLYRYAATQKAPYAAAAETRATEQQTRAAAVQAAQARMEAQAREEAKRVARERAAIRDTGRDLDGRVADWSAVPADELDTLATGPEGAAHTDITGAQAEIERRGRETDQQQPLTREAQLRLIERYGGINPAHPVHAAEIASIRESGIGKNKKLFREGGQSLDTLAQQIHQDVQNGPETEADVLAWVGELAAGRTPKLYERGDMEQAARWAASENPQVTTAQGLLAAAKSGENRKRFWPLPLRVETLGAIGERLRGFRRMADVFALRHILNRHGEGSGDPHPITEADIAALPQILDADGPSEYAGKTRHGNDAVLSVRPYGDFYYVVEEIREGNKVLALHTLRKTKAPSLVSDVSPTPTPDASQSMARQKLAQALAEFKQRNPTRFAEGQGAPSPMPAHNSADIAKLEDGLRRVAPGVFADIDVRIGDLQQTMAAEQVRTPAGAEAVYLPRLHAEKDLIVITTEAALRNGGKTGLSRFLHESGHAYWRMLSPKTHAALRALYESDRVEKWSPLWKDGEIATEVSQRQIRKGGRLGLEEWFSELMAATNAEWASRRFRYDGIPRLVLDLAARMRAIMMKVWRQVTDQKGLKGAERTRILEVGFRDFLVNGLAIRNPVNTGAAYAHATPATPEARFAEAQPETPLPPARQKWGEGDERVRELEAKIEALKDNQAEDTEQQGMALRRDLREAKMARGRAHGEAVAERAAVTVDPIEKALGDIPAVAKMRAQVAALTAEIVKAKEEGRPPESLFDQRDALHARLEETRREAEKSLFPPPRPDEPLAFGDPNPPRNNEPPAKPVADGADEPDHLRPVRWQDMAEFSHEQLAERLERMRRLADGIAADDFESAARLKFLSSLVRETRDELDARRRDAEAEVEAAAYRSAEHAAEPATEARPSILAAEPAARSAEADATTRAALDAEAANAIPDAPVESYPVRADAEQIGAQVSASTLEARSGLGQWLEKVWALLRGFRGAVPELPVFKDAQRFQNFREGLRLMAGLDEVVRHDAQEAIDDIVAPLKEHLERSGRDKQARIAELYRQREKATTQQAKDLRTAEIRRLETEIQGDAWFIFQNTILYGDLFTRSRLYKRDDGSPVGLPGGLNPAEAEHLFKLWLQRAASHPQAAAIAEARKRHKAFVERIAADLKERGFAFAEGSNTNYFPHVLLEKWDGAIERVKAGTQSDFRSYLITPVGSEKPIETDYLKAMYYHAVQVMAHNRRADIIRDYVQREDIRPQLIEEAKEANRTRRDQDGPPVKWQQIFHSRYADKFSIFTPNPEEIPLHPELVIDRDALAARIGIVLGSGPIQEELRKAGLANIPLKPSEIQEMLVTGSKELWVLPTEVADALRGVSERAGKTDNLLTKILATGNGWWKKNILFAPQNWIRFDFNNLVSDGEKAFTSDPGMLRELIPAGKEVFKFITGDPTAGADVREAFRLGVLDTLTAAEVNALRSQRPFEAFETTKEHHSRVAVNRLTSFFTSSRWNTMGWSKLREATFRYAKYQADLKRMRNGASPAYGGAYWRNVEAIQRVGAPENIHEENRTGRGMGRTGPGSGPIMSATPYVLKWREAGLRREEAYATAAERAKKRQELEASQAEADQEVLARKAAAISRATFGDYGELTPNGNAIRKLWVPFFAWTEVNFRYHANLFRNMRDQLRSGDIDASTAARRLGGQAATLGARAAIGAMLRLAIPYISVNLWNAMGGDEDKLSEEDRRRFHLTLGTDDNGKVRVIYLNTAFTDVLKWFSGNRAAQLTSEVVMGQTDWQTAASAFGSSIVPDFLNNTLGSAGPVVKVPYTLIAQKSTFPDVTDQRTIPSYDLRRVILGQATDQVTAELIEMAINKDFVPGRSVGEWAQQAILQVRRRDPESWAFYAIKDKAATFEEEKTGKKDARSAYDAPDAQVLKGFRRAIFKGDIAGATRAYQRLLQLGYTAERFESSVRAQDPLYGIPKAMRREFIESLTPTENEQLRRAYRYYLRMQEMEGAGRQLFPKRGISERARERFMQRDRSDVLNREIGRALATQGDEAEIERKTERELAEAMRRN